MKNEKKVVVVTGASSGIGYKVACELAADGNKVYAGARKEEDIKKLSKINNIIGIPIDITFPDQIKEAVKRIEREEGHIDVLINNAGVTGWGAVMGRDMEHMRKVMNINFFGHVETIMLFYPLLRQSVQNPIIINISSQAGNYAMPFWSAYHSSKWALEAFSHCLRRELSLYGIRVAIIQPGAIESSAFSKDEQVFDEYIKNGNPEYVNYEKKILGAAFYRTGVSKEKSPMLVVNCIRHAIYHRRNRIYYQPGRRLVPDLIMAKLPYGMVDRILGKMLRKPTN